jgi:predicted nuclease of restriction endonuclease-like (RecB) superfamily
MKRKKEPKTEITRRTDTGSYHTILADVIGLLEEARRTSARAVNAIMTATYWAIGRRIVKEEQGGRTRAGYGEEMITRLSRDLTTRFGRGFGKRNLFQMRAFYLAYSEIVQTVSARLEPSLDDQKVQTTSGISRPAISGLAVRFPLPWSHYVELLAVEKSDARRFYEEEALRGGWTVRQLARQIDSRFYERTALSRNKAAMLKKGQVAEPVDAVTPDEEVKDPLVLEFLGLKDEYSESDLEEALISHLEHFLLELGNDFAFIGRQRRLRINDNWYRVDLLFFHRCLRCLVIIDLKLGKFTHADAGQMHLYLNYAHEKWIQPGENPPVGIILCTAKDESLVRYATDNLPNKVLVREYLMTLPDENLIAAEIAKARKMLESRTRVERPCASSAPKKP